MILPTCIDPDHNQIVSHNGRKLEITLALVTGMVDRNAAFMAKTCNFIVHSRVIGCCNNQKCLFQILFCKNAAFPGQKSFLRKCRNRNDSTFPDGLLILV